MKESRQPKPRRRTSSAVAEKSAAYRQLWRVVDGAVFDALYTHQDYLTPKGLRSARTSINKRVVGAVLGFAEQSARGRTGAGTLATATDRVDAGTTAPSRAASLIAVSKWRAVREGIARAFGFGRLS